MNDRAIAKLDLAQHALAECKTVMEAKQIADAAEAARVYLERTHASAETVNRATEIRILAERQMGEFLKTMPKNVGANGSTISGAVREPVKDSTPTLAEIGITKKESARAQKLAEIPKDEFNELVASAKASGGKLSTADILPQRTRRSPEKFNLKDWKRHTATMIDLRLRDVPACYMAAAVEFVAEFMKRYIR